MAIPESVVAAVVAEVSERMQDSQYGQLAVGGFLQRHPDVGRYVSARSKAMPSEEAVVHAIFHAHVLEECYRRHRGRDAVAIGFADLDAAATPQPMKTLSDGEPALADYIVSNTEGDGVHHTLALVALALARA